MSEEGKAKRKALALEVAEIVHVCAARLVEQVVETIYESHIAPRRQTMRALFEEAKEAVHHNSTCPGIASGDGACDCGAVAFLSKFEAAVNAEAKP